MSVKVEKLYKKSNNALSLIRGLVKKLVDINEEVSREVMNNFNIMQSHEDAIQALQAENVELNKVHTDNTIAITNFKKLLGE